MPEAKVSEWIRAFDADPPLYMHFPLTLTNGTCVPGLHVVCSNCQGTLSGDRVHGRVIQSLKHVITIAANGLCGRCSLITHIDCRFRSNGHETVIEWLGSNGRWQSRAMRPVSLVERLVRTLRRLVAAP